MIHCHLSEHTVAMRNNHTLSTGLSLATLSTGLSLATLSTGLSLATLSTGLSLAGSQQLATLDKHKLELTAKAAFNLNL